MDEIAPNPERVFTVADKPEYVDMISEATQQRRRRVVRMVDPLPEPKETSRLSHWPPDRSMRR